MRTRSVDHVDGRNRTQGVLIRCVMRLITARRFNRGYGAATYIGALSIAADALSSTTICAATITSAG
jgi:hypothetical protein